MNAKYKLLFFKIWDSVALTLLSSQYLSSTIISELVGGGD